MDNQYKISLGVDIDVSDIQSQINTSAGKLDRIPIKVEIENIKELKSQIQDLGKGNKNLLAFDTSKIESSLKDVKGVISDIRTSLSTLDSGAGMKSLLSSINQISTALDKASGKFEELTADLKVLSSKDFSINFGVNMGGSNSVGNNAAYGNYVRTELYPELKKQEQTLVNAIATHYKTNPFNALDKLYKNTGRVGGLQNIIVMLDELEQPIKKGQNLTDRISGFQTFFREINEMARIEGIDLSPVYSQFDKTADQIVKTAYDIQNGTSQVEQNFERLKQVFGGSGIDAEGLTAQLDSIVVDLGEIKTAIQDLSSGASLDGLTQSFNRLSDSIELLVKNCTNMKIVINDSISGLNGSVSGAGSGFENIENDMSQITITANNATDTIEHMRDVLSKSKFDNNSINIVTKDLEEMSLEVKRIETNINGKNLRMSITGLETTEDGVRRVVSIIKNYNDETGEITTGNKKIIQTFDTTSDAAKRLAEETKKSFNKLKSLAKEMGQFDVDIAKLEASGDTRGVESLKRKLSELNAEYDELYANTSKNLSAEQFKELDNIFENTTNEVRELKNELVQSNESQKLTSDFEKLKSIAKEIANLKIDLFNTNDEDDIVRITSLLDNLEKEYNDILVGTNGNLSSSQLSQLDNIAKQGEQALSKLANKIDEVKTKLANSIKIDIELGKYDNQMSQMYDNFNKLSDAGNELCKSVEQVENAYREMELAATPDADGLVDNERIIRTQKEYAAALERTNNLIRIQTREEKAAAAAQKLQDNRDTYQAKIDAWLKKNSAAVKQFGSALLDLRAKAETADQVELNHLEKEFLKIDKAAEKAGVKCLSLGDKIKSKLKEYSAYFSVAEVFMYTTQAMKDMFNQVVAIDSAMTELKKVTDETESSYNQFLSKAASRAKELGTTIDGLVASTADFARLGYEFTDAQGLAEVANIYAVVGDEIDSVETATQSLVSTLTAFKDEAGDMSDSDFALSIVDKMNEVSNNFAISSGGIGEALQRSASSMMAANNSLDETIALITAANTVVQDPDMVGRVMPT